MQTLVADHPLVAHKLTALRDISTETPVFRSLTDELVTLLAYEATRHIKVERVTVHTPVADAEGVRLARPMPAGHPGAAGRDRHARRHVQAAAEGRRRLRRAGQGREDPDRLHVRDQAAGRPDRAGHVRARSDARHRRHAGHGLRDARVPRRRVDDRDLPARRPRGDRAGPARPSATTARSRSRSSPRASTTSSTRRATSCLASATPATASTARSSRPEPCFHDREEFGLPWDPRSFVIMDLVIRAELVPPATGR